MHELQDSDGCFGYGEISGEIGNSSIPPGEAKIKEYKALIAKANSVDLSVILNHYNINYSNTTIICPFKSHKGGREGSASFKIYLDTNSYFCFGCKKGGQNHHSCDFVATMDGISKVKAAIKIIETFNGEITDVIYEEPNLNEKLQILLTFSTIVREFRQKYTDEKSVKHIENICRVYDAINKKHELDNQALLSVINKLKIQVDNYAI